MRFPAPKESYANVFLEDTDRPLPEIVNQKTRYAYFKTIARGGKSIIQSCKDMHLSRVVCYKSLKAEFADDPLEQRRLLREARVSAMLQHPNTVPTYELGRDNSGHYFFTMKFVHGYTLREVLDYRERYDLTQMIDVVVQVGHALEYAHTHGVAHRDIKPENILVGPFGEILVLDWGLAKVWNPDGTSTDASESRPPDDSKMGERPDTSITGQAQLEGTITYMSPEQVRQDPAIDYRTDVYSLGLVLYEILAGRTPYKADRVDSMLEEILETTPELPSAVTNLFVPSFLEEVCMRCIRKDPDTRVQTVAELIRSLQEDWR